MRGPGTSEGPFGYCLNTSTIREQGLGLGEELELAARVGYTGLEPWVREMDAYVEAGGRLSDLAKKAADLGMLIPNAIGFFDWAVDDPRRREEGFEEARRCMELCRQIGCRRLAAPPSGITDVVDADLDAIAERYGQLLDVGQQFGVTPMVEFWGMSKTLGRLGEALYVAVESGRREACILADVFHMYKGGSPFDGICLLGPQTLGLVHVNDYPAEPARDEITDADRVYPGDGIAPLSRILRDLYDIGYHGMLSIELFNEQYYRQDAREVVRSGLAKLQQQVGRALSGWGV